MTDIFIVGAGHVPRFFHRMSSFAGAGLPGCFEKLSIVRYQPAPINIASIPSPEQACSLLRKVINSQISTYSNKYRLYTTQLLNRASSPLQHNIRLSCWELLRRVAAEYLRISSFILQFPGRECNLSGDGEKHRLRH